MPPTGSGQPQPLRKIALLLVFAFLTTLLAGLVTVGPLSPKVSHVAAEDDRDGIKIDWDGRGPDNIVQVRNQNDDRRRIRGSIQLNRSTGDAVAPVNSAVAEASCTDCQTIAVALQVNLIGKDASLVTPQNTALAVNYKCTRCITVAVALQYVISVDDPREVPRDVDRLIREMDRELREVSKDEKASLNDVVARINAVIDQFRTLAGNLNDKRDEETGTTSSDATPENFASPVASPFASPEAPPNPTEAGAESAPESVGSSDPESEPTAPAEPAENAETPPAPTTAPTEQPDPSTPSP
jgi:putative peptide zinc metalloprotease protein